jgi:integrase
MNPRVANLGLTVRDGSRFQLCRSRPGPHPSRSWNMTRQAKTEAKVRYRGPVSMAELLTEIEIDYRSLERSAGWISNTLMMLRFLVEDAGVRTTAEINDRLIRRLPALLEKKKPHLPSATRNNYLAILSAALNRAFELGLLPSELKFPEIPHPRTVWRHERSSLLSPDDMNRFLRYLNPKAVSLERGRFHVLVEAIVRAGLRRQEAVQLRRDHIDFEEHTIHVLAREKKRGGLPNPVRMSAELELILKRWLDWLPADCPYVIPGKRLTGPWANRARGDEALKQLRAAARAAGIKQPVTFEDLRRFFDEHSVPSLPCLDVTYGPASPGEPSGNGILRLAPAHELTDLEATNMMAVLKRRAASFQEHRSFTFLGLCLLQGFTARELGDARVDDVSEDRGRWAIRVPRRGGRVVILGKQAAEILKGWMRRRDRGNSPYLFPSDDRVGKWIAGRARDWLGDELRQVAAEVGIPGRLTLGSVHKFWERSHGRFELDEAYRKVRKPTPVPRHPKWTGPADYRTGRPLWGPWAFHDRPAIDISEEGHLIVQGEDKGKLSPLARDIIEGLIKARPEGLSRKALEERFGTSVHPTLSRLRRRDVDIRQSIPFPRRGRPGDDSQSYRVL